MRRDARMVHKRIRQTAKELAGCYYEFAAHDNQFYAFYPNRGFFINREWPKFVLVAKQTLTDCLRSSILTDKDKGEIYDALIADSTLPYSRQETQVVNVPH